MFTNSIAFGVYHDWIKGWIVEDNYRSIDAVGALRRI